MGRSESRFFPVVLSGFSALLLALSGCGESDPRHKELVPASGTIYYNGNPIDEAAIVFLHEDPTKQGGAAFYHSDGTFTLRTFGGNGTYPGNYLVTVIKDKIISSLSEEEIARRERESKDVPSPVVKSQLPQKYREKGTTDLTITIPPQGDKNLRIELSD